ncbi:MAG: citramalate synthase [Fibromonadaceae bacterium]|jgi:2-isopropylmalate synthase|nr:citramalate synthase [Fibromonadaceae bacterium]
MKQIGKMPVSIYDTTLRDGNQARGINLSLNDKIMITHLLNDFGADYIEGGWPNKSNPTDEEYFRLIRNEKILNSKIAAFGSTRRPKTQPEQDLILQHLVKSEAPVKTIFGKSWDIHVTEVIHTELEENLDMIGSSVEFLKKHSEEVIYDAEHFFDGYKANAQYAIETIKRAEQACAKCIVLCDTNGGTMPWEIEEIVKEVLKNVNCNVGIHCHNDAGLAVANSLAAVKSGATHVQGVINGYGERCGNANLITILADLCLKMGYDIKCKDNMPKLRYYSLAIDEVANLQSDVRAPYVGETAFAHKGGAHIDGVLKITSSFEHIDPEAVGNTREFITSDQAGGALIAEKLSKILPNIDKKSPVVAELLECVKQKENQGFAFDTAEASFEVLARRHLGLYEDKFKTLGYRVIEDMGEDGIHVSEASVKLQIGEKIVHEVSEGDGPVNALDRALRKALDLYFPSISAVKLDDYKVRVLGSKVGTDASVRVWITFGDGKENWHTAGVSTNIIEASWFALLDGIHYKIMRA